MCSIFLNRSFRLRLSQRAMSHMAAATWFTLLFSTKSHSDNWLQTTTHRCLLCCDVLLCERTFPLLQERDIYVELSNPCVWRPHRWCWNHVISALKLSCSRKLIIIDNDTVRCECTYTQWENPHMFCTDLLVLLYRGVDVMWSCDPGMSGAVCLTAKAAADMISSDRFCIRSLFL